MIAIAFFAVFVASEPWKLVNEVEGVKVYSRHEDGSKLVSIRGVGIVDAPIRTVASVLLDDARLPEWAQDVDARVVRVIDAHEYIEYNHVVMPPLIADREFITHVTLAADPEYKTAVIVSEPIDSDPDIPHTKRVRGLLRANYEMQSLEPNKTRLTVTMHTDPKGALPPWLVNYFARDWPGSTLKGIRKQCAKKDIAPPKEFAEFVASIVSP